MISAQELRIGNWVNYQTEEGLMLCQIDAEDIYNIARKHMASDELHSPIPLTPEILEKAGFECQSKGHYMKGTYHKSNIGKLYLKPSPQGWLIQMYPMEPLTSVKYLHHLMNLYFVITGEELTLNP